MHCLIQKSGGGGVGGMLDGEEWAISVALAGEQECSTLNGLNFIKPIIQEMFCVT